MDVERPVKELSLKMLSLKLTMLISLTNVLRVHPLNLLSVKDIIRTNNEFCVQIQGRQKQSRPARSTFNVFIQKIILQTRDFVFIVFLKSIYQELMLYKVLRIPFYW